MHGPALDLEVATFQPLNSTGGKQNTAYYYSVYKNYPFGISFFKNNSPSSSSYTH